MTWRASSLGKIATRLMSCFQVPSDCMNCYGSTQRPSEFSGCCVVFNNLHQKSAFVCHWRSRRVNPVATNCSGWIILILLKTFLYLLLWCKKGIIRRPWSDGSLNNVFLNFYTKKKFVYKLSGQEHAMHATFRGIIVIAESRAPVRIKKMGTSLLWLGL